MTRSFLLNAAGVALAVLTFPIWMNAALMALALVLVTMPAWCFWLKCRRPSAKEHSRPATRRASRARAAWNRLDDERKEAVEEALTPVLHSAAAYLAASDPRCKAAMEADPDWLNRRVRFKRKP
jgi:hypothetical protein